MLLANLWGKLNTTNIIVEFVIVTLSVIVALAGDKYLADRNTLEQERVALTQIYDDIKRDYNSIQWTLSQVTSEDTLVINLLRHAANDTTLIDSSVNAGFNGLLHFNYFDRTIASTLNYDAKIKHAGRQVIQSDSLSTTLGKYYDSSLNNLTLWTEARKDMSSVLQSTISEERGYLDNGSNYIHQIMDKSFHEVLGEMTSNIRIMGCVSDLLAFNRSYAQALEWNSQLQRRSIRGIEVYFTENDIPFDPFDPGAI